MSSGPTLPSERLIALSPKSHVAEGPLALLAPATVASGKSKHLALVLSNDEILWLL